MAVMEALNGAVAAVSAGETEKFPIDLIRMFARLRRYAMAVHPTAAGAARVLKVSTTPCG